MSRPPRRLAPLRRRAARLLLLWACLGLVLALPPAGGVMAAPPHGGETAAMESPGETTDHCLMSGPTAGGDGDDANHQSAMGEPSSSAVCDGPGCLCCPLLGGSGHHAGPGGALGNTAGLRNESLLAYRIPEHRDIHLPPEGPPPRPLV